MWVFWAAQRLRVDRRRRTSFPRGRLDQSSASAHLPAYPCRACCCHWGEHMHKACLRSAWLRSSAGQPLCACLRTPGELQNPSDNSCPSQGVNGEKKVYRVATGRSEPLPGLFLHYHLKASSTRLLFRRHSREVPFAGLDRIARRSFCCGRRYGSASGHFLRYSNLD